MDINLGSKKLINLEQIGGLGLIFLAYILFIFSSFGYQDIWWFPWLLGGRVAAAFLAILAIAVLFFKTSDRPYDAWFYTVALGIQSIHGAMEGSGSTEFYAYTGVLYIVAALASRFSFKLWMRTLFPFQFGFLLMPLFFKDAAFFSSVGRFVDAFSLPISGFVVGTIIVWLNSQRFSVLSDNLELQRSLSEVKDLLFLEQQDRLEKARSEIEEMRSMVEKAAEMRSTALIAAQVSHDIRSPISALNIVVSQLQGLSERQKSVMVSAIGRISDIATMLLQKSKNLGLLQETLGSEPKLDSPILSPEFIPILVESVVAEKRFEYKDCCKLKISLDLDDSYGGVAKVNAVEFCRMMSNLINNAVESLDASTGEVGVRVECRGAEVIVTVSDTGCGIPESVLSRLGELGNSQGKGAMGRGGSGLGVYHAMRTMSEFNGKFQVETSQCPGISGTTVKLSLPAQPAPGWFAREIVVAEGARIVTVDDDSFVHGAWAERFARDKVLECGAAHYSFTSGDDFEGWFNKNRAVAGDIFLIDYDFKNQVETGLDIISRLGLEACSFLVTSRFSESGVIEESITRGIKLVPKPIMGFVPMRFPKQIGVEPLQASSVGW